MAGVVLLIVLLNGLSVLCEGLELTLDGDTKFIQGNQPTCGVLRCVEDIDTSRPVAITRMSVFRKSHSGSDQSHLVTSVSEEQPEVSRFHNGVKMDGTWTARHARVTLYLLRPDLCRGAEFTCEVRSLDAQEKELVSTSSVGRPGEASGGCEAQADSTSSSSSASLGQEVKETIKQMQDWLERAMDRLENRLEDKIVTLQARLDDKVSTLQGRLEDKLYTLQNRLDDKLSTLQTVFDDNSRQLENRLEDKLDAKLSTRGNVSNENQENCQDQRHVDESLDRKIRSLEERLNATVQQTMSGINQFFNSQKIEFSANATEASEKLEANLLETISQANASIFSDIQSRLSTTMLEPRKFTTCERGRGGLNTFHPVVDSYHLITPGDGETPYLCDPHTEGGGWIIIQRRSTGLVNFERDWAAYKRGFGSLDDDFWLGNDRIHNITRRGTYELRVSLRYQGKSAFAHYDSFALENEATNFTIRLGEHSGTAEDAFPFKKVIPFSSMDRDNDGIASINCARTYHGAWWFWPANCVNSFLNGKWVPEGSRRPKWLENALGFSEMKIRRK